MAKVDDQIFRVETVREVGGKVNVRIGFEKSRSSECGG